MSNVVTYDDILTMDSMDFSAHVECVSSALACEAIQSRAAVHALQQADRRSRAAIIASRRGTRGSCSCESALEPVETAGYYHRGALGEQMILLLPLLYCIIFPSARRVTRSQGGSSMIWRASVHVSLLPILTTIPVS